MCGIAGYLILKDKKRDGRKLRRMSDLLSHRGPDDEGFILMSRSDREFRLFASEDSPPEIRSSMPDIRSDYSVFKHDLAMAHRRFSIIDLSYLGHQPMSDVEQTLFTVLNGEIFNYIELRAELETKGVTFRSRSDTEVLLASYKEWGLDFVRKLTGFWAFSLYDFKNDLLILSRDRIGKKPLYYFRNEEMIVWASEIKSILSFLKKSDITVDSRSVNRYLLSGIKDYSHSTFWKDIKMADNGSSMIFDLSTGKEHVKKFWKIPLERKCYSETDIPDSISVFRENLTIALTERLRSDVPVAFELSGGLDSSALVALRAGLSRENFHVFTVKYEGKKFDESSYASKLVKKYNNIEHHIINFQSEDLFQYLDDFNFLMEEPFHGPVLLIGQLLRRKINQRGYKVIIGGAGGDEIFGGYTEYAIPVLRDLRDKKKYSDFLKNILFYKEKYPLSFIPFFQLLFRKIFGIGYDSSFQKKYLNLTYKSPLFESDIRLPKDANDLFLKNMEDLKMYYWMSSNDKSDMGIPVEVRNPLLDHRVVEQIFRLPTGYLFKNGWLKWFLRKSFEKELPRSILWRKRKQGFPFPLSEWLEANSKKLKDILIGTENEFLKTGDIISDYDSIRMKDPAFLWRMINLNLWLRTFDLSSGEFFKSGAGE